MDYVFDDLQAIGEKKDYVLNRPADWATESDTIATIVWTVSAGLTASLQSNTTTAATIWLERTLAGVQTVTAKLTSAAGRVDIVTWGFA
jgi:hypothetical protein